MAEFAPASTADGSPAAADMVSNHVCLICLHARACLYVYVLLVGACRYISPLLNAAGAVTHPAGARVASARAQFQCIVHFLMLPDACCLCMLLVQVDEAGASSVVDGRDVSSADAASAGMVKVRVLFSSFDQFHVHACACWYISCSTPLVLLLYSLRAHVCVHTVHPAVTLLPAPLAAVHVVCIKLMLVL